MFKWIKENDNRYIGFVDGDLWVIVFQQDDGTWSYDSLQLCERLDGCESAEEAMRYAEEYHEDFFPEEEEEVGYSLEDIEEIKGEMWRESEREETLL